jgi:hypothetical protein
MIIVKTMGGLGNQLFQYACGRALAKRLGVELRVWRSQDTQERHADQPARPYRLWDFAVNAQIASDDDLAQARFTAYENPFTFLPAVLGAPDGIALEGFWQTEKYFLDAKNTIRSELEFADPNHMMAARASVQLIRAAARGPVVAVHVRRGDYVLDRTKGIFHNLSLHWFQLAMSRMPAHVAFLIVSDDIAWCKTQFTGPRVHFSTATDDLSDLALMRACDGYIISNSSFSWWGAWLSDTPEPVVIAPDANHWFGELLMSGGQHDASHIIPSQWLRQPDDPRLTKVETPASAQTHASPSLADYEHLIPLGDHCATALTLSANGLRQHSYPFDWTSGLETIELHETTLAKNFQVLTTLLQNGNSEGAAKMYLGTALENQKVFDGIRFPHELLQNESASEVFQKYARRFARLHDHIASKGKNLYCVITRLAHVETQLLQEMLSLLRAYHSESALLLISGLDHPELHWGHAPPNIYFQQVPYDPQRYYTFDYTDFRPALDAFFAQLKGQSDPKILA